MTTLTGDKLSRDDQRYVLAVYVHRFTGDHTPKWAKELSPNDGAYAVQYASDQEWLERTQFTITQSGKLDHRIRRCLSNNPTWPNNPELRRSPTP